MKVFSTGTSRLHQLYDIECSDPVGVCPPQALRVDEQIETLPSSVLCWLLASEPAVEAVLDTLQVSIFSFARNVSNVRGMVATKGNLHQEVNSSKLMRESWLKLASVHTPSAVAEARTLGAKPTLLAT